MPKQKFHRGDLVQIADDLGPSMSHFPSGRRAVVINSYADAYGENHPAGATLLYDVLAKYCLWVEGCGEISWYEERQLGLIEHDRMDMVTQWDQEMAKYSDLDWIFANGAEVAEKAHGRSVMALAESLGLDLWGPRGEGVTYQFRASSLMREATPFLLAGDKAGWLKRAKELKA